MTIKELLGKSYKEGMTLEEIETALESIELPTDQSSEIDKLKNQLSKANSEAKGYKDKLAEKMSDEEKAAEQQKELMENLQKELDAYKQKDAINENTKGLLSLGYDEALAEATAKAMYEGDLKTVLANQKKFIESVKADVKSDILKNTPTPSGGEQKPNTVTKDQFLAMSYSQMLSFQKENPELFDEFTKGENNGE